MSPLVAATATEHHASLWPAVFAVAVIVLIYAGLCWVRPFARCSLCKGAGCRWCRYMGRRMRIGRWLWNKVTELRREAAAAERAEARR